MTNAPNGLEPRTYGPERRALYDARRQVAGLEDEVEALIAEVGDLQEQLAVLPRGLVAMGVLAIAHGGFTAGTYFDVNSMNVTFTAVAGRRYRATATFMGVTGSASANDWIAVRIEHPTLGTLGGVQQNLNPSGQEAFSAIMPPRTFSAGSVNLKVRAYFSVGPGNIIASGEFPCSFIVEDVGAA